MKKYRNDKAKELIKIKEAVERGRRMEQELTEFKQSLETDAAAIDLLIEQGVLMRTETGGLMAKR